MPPHVKPKIHAVVEAMISALPNQSSFISFSRKLSRGAFSCRKKNTTTMAIAHSGRFISVGRYQEVDAHFAKPKWYVQKSQRHEACSANPPAMNGPIIELTVNILST